MCYYHIENASDESKCSQQHSEEVTRLRRRFDKSINYLLIGAFVFLFLASFALGEEDGLFALSMVFLGYIVGYQQCNILLMIEKNRCTYLSALLAYRESTDKTTST